MQIRRVNKEVLFVSDAIVKVGRHDIEGLKRKAKGNVRKRIRLCVHRDVKDGLHEMLIIHKKDIYVRPHKHLNRSESFHIVEGTADVVVFDDAGDVKEVIRMGDYRSGRKFFYRVSEPYYHSLLINTDYLVFHETTNGPFNRSNTVFAPWAPEEADLVSVRRFLASLKKKID